MLDEEQLRGIAERINDLTPKPKWDSGPYTPYCLGLMFIQDHIMNKLRGKNKLTREEEKLLRRARGRVHYNPPKREYASQAKACQQLAANPQRDRELFAAVKAERNVLDEGMEKISKDARGRGKDLPDLEGFANSLRGGYEPMYLLSYVNGIEPHSFGELARRHEETAREFDKPGTFYTSKAAFYR